MLSIFDIQGNVLLQVPITRACIHAEELMRTDEIRLSWNSDNNDTLPNGAYVVIDGERYSLVEPYAPTQKRENAWLYEPVFVSAFFALAKVPFYMYTYESGAIVAREADWSLTAHASTFLETICKAIENETGLLYDYAVASDLTEFKTIPFNASGIISALSSIAGAFETEFWLEKYAAPISGKIGRIHLSFAKFGDERELEVGVDIGVPAVSDAGEPYYNRFIPLGSTRNIIQDYKGANVNSIASKRLTLDPTEYPGGYIDFSDGGNVFTKILQFENIYPAATKLVIQNVQARAMYELDEETQERIPIGTVDGQTVYSMYTIWYVQLKVKEGSTYTDFDFDDTTYDKDDNPNGMVLPGLVPSLHFNSGPLNGRDFEVKYHKNAESYNTPADAQPFTCNADCFEIIYSREGTYIIPDQASLIPVADNSVVLFNVRTPAEYYSDAYARLKAAALEEINKNYILLDANGQAILDQDGNPKRVDKNSYQFNSNPFMFSEVNLLEANGLYLIDEDGAYLTVAGGDNRISAIGQAVLYKNTGYELETRVTALETRLDFPVIQLVTIGNAVIKGALQELKEEAVNANNNIDLLAALNASTQQVLDAYSRTQQMIINGLADDFFELGTPSTLVKLKPSYEHLGPGKGLVFNPTDESDVASSQAHLMLRNLGTSANPNYALYTPYALITGGDQIVKSGTPGGGGGGSIPYLHELQDVAGSVTGKPSGQKILIFDPTATDKNGQIGAWKYSDVPSGSITSVALEQGVSNGSLRIVVNGTPGQDVIVKGLGSMAFASTNDYLPNAHDQNTVDANTVINSGLVVAPFSNTPAQYYGELFTLAYDQWRTVQLFGHEEWGNTHKLHVRFSYNSTGTTEGTRVYTSWYELIHSGGGQTIGGDLSLQSSAPRLYLKTNNSDYNAVICADESFGAAFSIKYSVSGYANQTLLSAGFSGGSPYASIFSGRYGTLEINALIRTSGDQVVNSDKTLKKNIQDLKYTVEDIAKAPAVSFDWKDKEGHSFGSIAQYWKPICPEMVHGVEGQYSLAYAQGAFTNTILLARRIVELEKQIKELKDKHGIE